MRAPRYHNVAANQRRPPLFPLPLLAVALGLLVFLAGCGPEKKPSSPNSPTPPAGPPAVTGLELTDDYGRVIRIPSSHPAGGLSLYAADSSRYALTLLGPSGPVDPLVDGSRFTIIPVFSDSGLAGGSATTSVHGDSLLLFGRRPGADSVRFRVAFHGTEVYSSPPVPLSLSELPAVGIDRLFILPPIDSLNGVNGFGPPRPPIVLTQGEVLDSLEADFSAENSGLSNLFPVSDTLLGHSARLVFLTDVPGVLQAGALRGRPFRFRLEAMGTGNVQLAIRLVRGTSILYQSASVPFRVVDPDSAWWPGFGGEYAPNGDVAHLAVVQNALIVSGNFTQVGGVAIAGLARWDGSRWWSLSWSHGLSPLVLTEEDALVAGSPAGGFYKWDGFSWTSFAPAYSRATGAALYHGELVVAHDSLYTWRGGAWTLLAAPAWGWSGRTYTGSPAVFQDHLYLDALSLVDMFEAPVAWVGRVSDGRYGPVFQKDGGPEGGRSPSIDYMKGSDNALFFSWDIDEQGLDSGVEERDSQGSTISAGGDGLPLLLARAVGDLNGRIYAGADISPLREAVLVGDSGNLRKLADVSGGKVADMATFQGSLYIGGSFTAIGGVPAFGLARYRP